MPQYNVTIIRKFSHNKTIEAENPDQAKELAKNRANLYGKNWHWFDLQDDDEILATEYVSPKIREKEPVMPDLTAYHPIPDGKFLDVNDKEIYVYDKEFLDTEQDLWEAFGLAPEDFSVNYWADADLDSVRSHIPTFYLAHPK